MNIFRGNLLAIVLLGVIASVAALQSDALALQGSGKSTKKPPKMLTVTLKPEECYEETKSKKNPKPKICNTGKVNITIDVGDPAGNIINIHIPDGGSADFTGNGEEISFDGSGSASLTVNGDGNKINTTLGSKGADGAPDVKGGSITVNGKKNEITNNDNGVGGGKFDSPVSGTSIDISNANTLKLGGESGNSTSGFWGSVGK